MPLWLIGMMGSGKSAVGRVLAARTDRDFFDTDRLVEASAGRSIGEIFAEEGERGFRLRESAAIAAAASSGDAVIATGGGAVLLPANVASMKASGTVVWLRADASTLMSRVGDRSSRPLLNGGRADDEISGEIDLETRLSTILEARSQAYELAADYWVPTDRATVEEVAVLVEEIWNAS